MIIQDNLSDHSDMTRQIRNLYIRSNVLFRKLQNVQQMYLKLYIKATALICTTLIFGVTTRNKCIKKSQGRK